MSVKDVSSYIAEVNLVLPGALMSIDGNSITKDIDEKKIEALINSDSFPLAELKYGDYCLDMI